MSITSAYAAPWSEPITIIDGNESRIVYSDGVLVKDILDQENMVISNLDMVYPITNNVVPDDRTIIIKRLKLVDVEYAGHNISYWTDAETYRDFILKGTTLADVDDIFDVNLDDKISQGANKITITKVDHVTQYEEEPIPYTTKTIKDEKSPKGTKKVVTKGVNGVMKKIYDVELHNDVEVSRTYVSDIVSQKPVNEVISVGTMVQKAAPVKTSSAPVSAPAQTSSQTATVTEQGDNVVVVNGQTIHYRKVLNCKATAYDLSYESCGKRPGSPGYGITASGTYAKVGTVAVDPKVIPLGTKMFIVSADGSYVYGYCTAEDTGGGIKGNKVDLFYNTRAECLQFGRRNVIVYIL